MSLKSYPLPETVRASFEKLLCHKRADDANAKGQLQVFTSWGYQLGIPRSELLHLIALPPTTDALEASKALSILIDMILLTISDQYINDKELHILGDFARENGIPIEQVDQIVRSLATAPEDQSSLEEIINELRLFI